MITSIFLTELFLIAGFILAILIVAHLLRQRRSPTATIAWLLIIAFLPYVGVPLYLLLGGRKMRRIAGNKSRISLPDDAAPSAAGSFPVERLLKTYGIPGACAGNRLTLCATGEDAYGQLVRLIDEASCSISVLTFILHEDPVGKDIVNRLARRASEGLQVRVLMDGYGSLYTRRRFLAPLIEAGGRTSFFIPLIHWPFHGRTNLRNHRKIVIADESRVLAGGMNIGADYMGPTPKAGRWRDLSFILEGPAVKHYVEIFRSDWEFATGDAPAPGASRAFPPPSEKDGAIVQVVPSGPDTAGDPLYDTIISMVFDAKERIWIVTPYFIPDEPLLHSLRLALHRGIDVRILVPQKSNHPLTDLARGTYLRDLEDAGAKILLYTEGMMHAKAILADHDIAMIGSANVDIRSLFLDYEVAVFLYGEKEIRSIEEWIGTVASASRIGLRPAGAGWDILEGVARLMAPLL